MWTNKATDTLLNAPLSVLAEYTRTLFHKGYLAIISLINPTSVYKGDSSHPGSRRAIQDNFRNDRYVQQSPVIIVTQNNSVYTINSFQFNRDLFTNNCDQQINTFLQTLYFNTNKFEIQDLEQGGTSDTCCF